jgi:hypothetical protein
MREKGAAQPTKTSFYSYIRRETTAFIIAEVLQPPHLGQLS